MKTAIFSRVSVTFIGVLPGLAVPPGP